MCHNPQVEENRPSPCWGWSLSGHGSVRGQRVLALNIRAFCPSNLTPAKRPERTFLGQGHLVMGCLLAGAVC